MTKIIVNNTGAMENESIKCWPNPVVNEMHVIMPVITEGSYKITDVRGVSIMQNGFEGKEISFNLNQLSPGSYILHLLTRNGSYIKYFIKNQTE